MISPLTSFDSGESVYSNIVKLKVAKATTNECSFPKFKIALVVCEEKYQKTAQFPSLKATRNDAEALIRALQELQFQVLAFTNITLDQLRNAIDLFSSFIDEETYALFYYNGHAVGHHEDIYLATVETSLGNTFIAFFILSVLLFLAEVVKKRKGPSKRFYIKILYIKYRVRK